MKKVKCANGHFFDAEKFESCPLCGEKAAETAGAISRKEPEHISKTEPLVSKRGSFFSALHEGERKANTHSRVPDTPKTERHTINDDTGNKIDDYISQIIAEVRSEGIADLPSEEKTHGTNPGAFSLPEQPSQDKDTSDVASALWSEVKATAAQRISSLPKTVSYYDVEADIEPPVGWIVSVKGPYQGRAFMCKAGKNRIGRAANMDICLTEDAKVSREAHASIIYEPKQRKFYVLAGKGSGLTYLNGELIFEHADLMSYDKLSIGKSEFVFLPLCGDRFSWDDYLDRGER